MLALKGRGQAGLMLGWLVVRMFAALRPDEMAKLMHLVKGLCDCGCAHARSCRGLEKVERMTNCGEDGAHLQLVPASARHDTATTPSLDEQAHSRSP